MRIIVDAEVLQQRTTGVGKTLLGMYSACLSLDPGLEIYFVHQHKLFCRLPAGIHSISAGRCIPSRLWRLGILPMMALITGAVVIHFPWNGRVPVLWGKAKVVSTLHDVLPLDIPDFFAGTNERQRYKTRTQRDIDRSHLLITPSSYSATSIKKHFRVGANLMIIPWGVPQNRKSGRRDLAPSAGKFLYVGGYDRRKGLEMLVNTFLELHKTKRLKTGLVLVGEKDAYIKGLGAQVIEAKAKGILDITGYLDEDRLLECYEQSLALVYPSAYEGFGLPPLEAMAAGCAVVATDGTAVPSVCGDAAILVPRGDAEALACALIRIENDAELRAELCRKGLEQSRKFLWEASATMYLDALRELVS